jgi:hypothetical protein
LPLFRPAGPFDFSNPTTILPSSPTLSLSPPSKATPIGKKQNYWQKRHQEIADELHEYNIYAKNDPRVDTVLLPLRDGITIMKRVG